MLNVVDEAMKDSKNEENQTVIRWVISKRLKLMALGCEGVTRLVNELRDSGYPRARIIHNLNGHALIIKYELSPITMTTTRGSAGADALNRKSAVIYPDLCVGIFLMCEY